MATRRKLTPYRIRQRQLIQRAVKRYERRLRDHHWARVGFWIPFAAKDAADSAAVRLGAMKGSVYRAAIEIGLRYLSGDMVLKLEREWRRHTPLPPSIQVHRGLWRPAQDPVTHRFVKSQEHAV